MDHNPHSSLCHTDNDPQNLKQPCHNSPSHTTVVVGSYATILVPVSSSNWESNYFSLSVLTEPQNNMTQLHTLNAQFKLWLVVHFVYVGKLRVTNCRAIPRGRWSAQAGLEAGQALNNPIVAAATWEVHRACTAGNGSVARYKYQNVGEMYQS